MYAETNNTEDRRLLMEQLAETRSDWWTYCKSIFTPSPSAAAGNGQEPEDSDFIDDILCGDPENMWWRPRSRESDLDHINRVTTNVANELRRLATPGIDSVNAAGIDSVARKITHLVNPQLIYSKKDDVVRDHLDAMFDWQRVVNIPYPEEMSLDLSTDSGLIYSSPETVDHIAYQIRSECEAAVLTRARIMKAKTAGREQTSDPSSVAKVALYTQLREQCKQLINLFVADIDAISKNSASTAIRTTGLASTEPGSALKDLTNRLAQWQQAARWQTEVNNSEKPITVDDDHFWQQAALLARALCSYADAFAEDRSRPLAKLIIERFGKLPLNQGNCAVIFTSELRTLAHQMPSDDDVAAITNPNAQNQPHSFDESIEEGTNFLNRSALSYEYSQQPAQNSHDTPIKAPKPHGFDAMLPPIPSRPDSDRSERLAPTPAQSSLFDLSQSTGTPPPSFFKHMEEAIKNYSNNFSNPDNRCSYRNAQSWQQEEFTLGSMITLILGQCGNRWRCKEGKESMQVLLLRELANSDDLSPQNLMFDGTVDSDTWDQQKAKTYLRRLIRIETGLPADFNKQYRRQWSLDMQKVSNFADKLIEQVFELLTERGNKGWLVKSGGNTKDDRQIKKAQGMIDSFRKLCKEDTGDFSATANKLRQINLGATDQEPTANNEANNADAAVQELQGWINYRRNQSQSCFAFCTSVATTKTARNLANVVQAFIDIQTTMCAY